jgi:hypothetical protein
MKVLAERKRVQVRHMHWTRSCSDIVCAVEAPWSLACRDEMTMCTRVQENNSQ